MDGKHNVTDRDPRASATPPIRVLGIETSCDETAAAVVSRDADGRPVILSSIVLSQDADHAAFGGVVPEIAARAHLGALDSVIAAALEEAELELGDIDAIAATAGPGLIGGLLVGIMTAKGLAAAAGKPFLAINHLEGHALTPRLTDDAEFPYLLLLVSGGHTQILEIAGLGDYRRIATTIDDALGECFDKTAKLLSLGFPGGPAVERAAIAGDDTRFDLPKPMQGRTQLDFSFSGLKTAIRQTAQALAPVSQADIADLCASFERTVAEIVIDRLGKAMTVFEERHPHRQRLLVAAGGVAANKLLRATMHDVCAARGWRFIAPPLKLCGDNAAMIAWAGLERFERGEASPFDTPARSRWPLDEGAETVIGSGKRGAKV